MKESSDGETLMAVGIWFQIWGAAEEKARRPKSGLALGTEYLTCVGWQVTLCDAP